MTSLPVPKKNFFQDFLKSLQLMKYLRFSRNSEVNATIKLMNKRPYGHGYNNYKGQFKLFKEPNHICVSCFYSKLYFMAKK